MAETKRGLLEYHVESPDLRAGPLLLGQVMVSITCNCSDRKGLLHTRHTCRGLTLYSRGPVDGEPVDGELIDFHMLQEVCGNRTSA